MGQAIGKNFAEAGNNVQYYGSKDTAQQLGDIVVMAVPYPALVALAKQYQAELAGKIVVDITNPLNFETWDELVVPADSSAAQQLQKLLPESKVLKALTLISRLLCRAAKSASCRQRSWLPAMMKMLRKLLNQHWHPVHCKY